MRSSKVKPKLLHRLHLRFVLPIELLDNSEAPRCPVCSIFFFFFITVLLLTAPVPLALTLPAAAGGFAYLSARASLGYDAKVFRAIFTGSFRMRWRERNQQLNMFEDLEAWVKVPSKANQDFLVFQGKHYTYRAMYDIVLRYGHWMRTELGIKPGQIVAMNFDNSDKFVIVWLALWSVGAKPAFLNYNLTGHALAHCVKAASASLCIVDPAMAGNMEDIKQEMGGLPVIVLTPELQAKAAASPATHTPKAAREGQTLPDMAMLIYTSGTTGLPKPAVVSWKKVIVGSTISAILPDRGNGDIMYSVCFYCVTNTGYISVCRLLTLFRPCRCIIL